MKLAVIWNLIIGKPVIANVKFVKAEVLDKDNPGLWVWQSTGLVHDPTGFEGKVLFNGETIWQPELLKEKKDNSSK